MNRTPPLAVRRQLRRDVRFGCPVPGCGSPFLEWHHFDPPWSEKNHHDPEGMVALCTHHHPQADAGAFSKEQLRQFKLSAAASEGPVKGKFEWLRNSLLLYAGSNHYLETYEILRFKGKPVIWFTRDEHGHLLLNLHPLTTSGEPRLAMEENFWLVHGNQEDLECPPSGRFIRVKYPNGDEFGVEFFELHDANSIRSRYPKAHPKVFEIDTPITAVEVTYRVANSPIDFGPHYTRIGNMYIQQSFSKGSGTAFIIG